MGPMLVLVLAATRIQKHWRGMRTRRALLAGGVAAVVGQSAWGQTAEQRRQAVSSHTHPYLAAAIPLRLAVQTAACEIFSTFDPARFCCQDTLRLSPRATVGAGARGVEELAQELVAADGGSGEGWGRESVEKYAMEQARLATEEARRARELVAAARRGLGSVAVLPVAGTEP